MKLPLTSQQVELGIKKLPDLVIFLTKGTSITICCDPVLPCNGTSRLAI
jgi:hypothetical protein